MRPTAVLVVLFALVPIVPESEERFAERSAIREDVAEIRALEGAARTKELAIQVRALAVTLQSASARYGFRPEELGPIDGVTIERWRREALVLEAEADLDLLGRGLGHNPTTCARAELAFRAARLPQFEIDRRLAAACGT